VIVALDADDDFNASEGDINIGISVKKGNTALADMMDAVLNTMTEADFNDLMNSAIADQPEI
jgi:putative lysine transport system substrate-binding protein